MTKDMWEVFQDDDEIKVIVSGSLEEGCGWRSCSDICSEINNLEDAKLIASAPALKKALEDLVHADLSGVKNCTAQVKAIKNAQKILSEIGE